MYLQSSSEKNVNGELAAWERVLKTYKTTESSWPKKEEQKHK